MCEVIRRPTTVLAGLALALAGCARPQPIDAPDSTEAGPASAVVEVSSYPLEYVLTRLVGSLAEVRFRAGAAPDPAHWRPTPEEVAAMQRADLIVINGASYEGWLRNVSLPPSRVVDTTAEVADRLIAVSEGVTHSHGPEGEHEHAGTAFTTWLDPTLLQGQAAAAAAAMAERWPEHAPAIESRLAELDRDLTALDSELERSLGGLAEAGVVYSHPVYQYLDRRYGIGGQSVNWEPDEPLGEKRLAELRHLMDHGPVRVVVWEGEPLPENTSAIEALGLTSVVFSPCGSRPRSGDYLDAMRRNLAAIDSATLGGRPGAS